MLWWSLPRLPGFSVFMFVIGAIILILGLAAYVSERRKEIKKEKAQAIQSENWA